MQKVFEKGFHRGLYGEDDHRVHPDVIRKLYYGIDDGDHAPDLSGIGSFNPRHNIGRIGPPGGFILDEPAGYQLTLSNETSTLVDIGIDPTGEIGISWWKENDKEAQAKDKEDLEQRPSSRHTQRL